MATKKKSSSRRATPATRSSLPSLGGDKVRSGPARDASVERLEAIVSVMERSSLTELSYEDSDIILKLTRSRPGASHGTGGSADWTGSADLGVRNAGTHAMGAPQERLPDDEGARGKGSAPTAPRSGSVEPSTPAPRAPLPSHEDSNLHLVRSPFVGTFYRSPSPNDPPFVQEGQRVVRGQTLCIVEAMKLMNEIESEVEGAITEVLAENGKPVQFGEVLFKITPGKSS